MPTTPPEPASTPGRHRPLIALALAVGVGLGACSSDDRAVPSSDPATTTMASSATPAPSATPARSTTIDPTEARTIEQVNEYVAQAAAFDQAGADAQFPQGLTFAAAEPRLLALRVPRTLRGRRADVGRGPDRRNRSLPERGAPSSYLELKELAASGATDPAGARDDLGRAGHPRRPARRTQRVHRGAPRRQRRVRRRLRQRPDPDRQHGVALLSTELDR